MYTFKVRIHPNNKQATKIRRTMNKCVECQNMVYDYIDSFIKQGKKIPSCADVRKWFTVQKAINDRKTIAKRAGMTKKEMIDNYLDTLFYEVSNDALKQTVKDTYNSFVRYFKKLSKYPNRKSYKDKKKSFYVDPFKIEITSTQVDENAQHFYRKLGYKDCGGLVIDIPVYEQPMELFLIKSIK